MDLASDTDELLARKHALDQHAIANPLLGQRLHALREWQATRLAGTYGDLHDNVRYRGAVEFFLEDLYGPQDFTQRDRDVARAWSTLKRALPAKAIEILTHAVQLNVLTAELDHAMISVLSDSPITYETYAEAYREVGQADARKRQIALVLQIGADLSHIVGHAWIGIALKAAHVPAHAAGLGALQDFLERGYASFRRAGRTEELLDAIRERETHIMNALFNGATAPFSLADRAVGGSK